MSETPFAETELLLAVMQGRHDRAVALAEDMLPSERRRFVEQLNQAADYVHYLCDTCGHYVPPTPRPENAWTSPPPRPGDRVIATINALSPDRESKVWHRRCAPERFR